MKDDKVAKAIEILKSGGIIIFPTDTAFGIGCRLDNEKTIEKLFKLRKRPPTQATPVLVSSIEMAQEYLQPIPKEVLNLMEKYWPGALTIVFPCKVDKVPPLVRGGGKNLGVRMPNHPITIALINSLGIPVLGPSANFHGAGTPYRLKDLDPQLIKQVDYLLKGSCPIRNVSTVLDCSVKPFKLIRKGAVKVQI